MAGVLLFVIGRQGGGGLQGPAPQERRKFLPRHVHAPDKLDDLQILLLGFLPLQLLSAPGRFCSFSPNRKCRKMAGKGVQPLDNYTFRFCLSSLKQADKSGLDRLQAGKLAGV